MKAVLRVDASATIGLGHLSRCLTLARGLRRCSPEIIVEVAMRAPDDRLRRIVRREGLHLVQVEGDEADSIVETARLARGADLVVVDGYTFGVELHDAVLEAGPVLCVIDNLATSPVHADVVLNGNVFAERLRYADAELALVGPSYALVREEFLHARARREARAADDGGAPRVLLTMGGADPARATEAFLAELDALPPSRLMVVLGPAHPRAAEVRAVAARVRGHDVKVSIAAENMGELMERSDIAVAAAGSTCLELACVGVPSVVVAVADNQVPVAAELARRGMVWSAGRFETGTTEGLVATSARLLADRTARREMERAQRAVVDGLGQHRAASRLLEAVAKKRGPSRPLPR